MHFHCSLGELREKVQKRLLDIHDRERRKYLEKHSTVIYKPGDKVWMKVLAKDNVKLEPLWVGRCEVLERLERGPT